MQLPRLLLHKLILIERVIIFPVVESPVEKAANIVLEELLGLLFVHYQLLVSSQCQLLTLTRRLLVLLHFSPLNGRNHLIRDRQLLH